jgi:hypothetical protein
MSSMDEWVTRDRIQLNESGTMTMVAPAAPLPRLGAIATVEASSSITGPSKGKGKAKGRDMPAAGEGKTQRTDDADAVDAIPTSNHLPHSFDSHLRVAPQRR